MFSGKIIRESLKDVFILNDLKITHEETWNIDHAAFDQPNVWHVVSVEISDEEIERVSEALSHALDVGKWFVDFTDGQVIFVIFREKIFRYKKGDREQYEHVRSFGRSLGIPESQLHWEK